MTLANNARQAYGAAINQRHAPASAEHAKDSRLFRHAQITHQGQFQAARYRVAGYGGNHGFGQIHPGWTKGAMTDAMGVDFVTALGIVEGTQISARAKVATGTTEHRHFCGLVLFKVGKGLAQSRRSGAVDGVALVRSVHGDGDNAIVEFGKNGWGGHGWALRN